MPKINGSEIRGPALIVETNATTWLDDGWIAKCDPYGNLMLKQNKQNSQLADVVKNLRK